MLNVDGHVAAAPPDASPPMASPGDVFGARRAGSAARWSAAAIGGRQVLQLAFGVLLARLLGPGNYGVVGLATVYVTLSSLLLDQGLSAALVQRKHLSSGAPGAAATLNVGTGIVLAGVTWLGAPYAASFFHTPALLVIVRLLGCGLVLKAAAITPRAMLSRRLQFRALAVADILGAAAGAASGTTAVLLGASARSVVAQVVGTDVVVVIALLCASRGPRPTLQLQELGPLWGFGVRIFATNALAYFSRNTDNLLVGRYLGSGSLGLYGMAYRVLVIPVQLLGQTVTRVLFPVFSRISDDRERLGRALIAATELLAVAAVPTMAFLACSAPQFVVLGLGPQWRPAAPLVTVLALAGARETIFYITPALMTATGRADLNLRYEVAATALQVSGIVVGLRFGVLGVAVGYSAVGLLLTPVLMRIQNRLTGVTFRQQSAAIWPPLHASCWAAGAYLLLGHAHWAEGPTLLAGTAAYLVVLATVFGSFHRAFVRRTVGRVLARREPRQRPPQQDDTASPTP